MSGQLWERIPGRGFAALSAGSATGAVLTTLGFTVAGGAGMPVLAILIFVVSLIIWAAGVMTLGAGVWVVLDLKGLRSPMIALATGFLLPFLTSVAFTLLSDSAI